MTTPGKRVRIYQISNNITDDAYIGSTTSVLYKRLYRHKYDADKGVRSKLRAREMSWIHQRRCSLNESYNQVNSEGEAEQTQPEPEQTQADAHGLNEYALHIMELQQQVKALQTQIKSLQSREADAQEEDLVKTISEAPSETTPQSFHISDDNIDADAPPEDLPSYDLTDKLLVGLKGVVDSDHLEIIRQCLNKLMTINKHVQDNPHDEDVKQERIYLKERLAKRIAIVRPSGPDQPSSRLVDTIEKEVFISKELRRKMLRQARSYRCDDD